MTPWKICKICGEYKDHHAHGMCKRCYWREHRAKKPRAKKPTNPECSTYLGCTVAEKVLSEVFNDVEIMKPNNPGYDFICNKGKKIDVKSSCIKKNRSGWSFRIKRNIIADFFLCIAFDNRKSLTPLHLWLIPSSEVKDKERLSIFLTTMSKLDDFKLNISKTLQCCDEMRS